MIYTIIKLHVSFTYAAISNSKVIFQMLCHHFEFPLEWKRLSFNMNKISKIRKDILVQFIIFKWMLCTLLPLIFFIINYYYLI